MTVKLPDPNSGSPEGVSTRFLKKFDDSQQYIESLLINAPDMGRAYQELGHLNRDLGNEDKAVMHYRQAVSYTHLRAHET